MEKKENLRSVVNASCKKNATVSVMSAGRLLDALPAKRGGRNGWKWELKRRRLAGSAVPNAFGGEHGIKISECVS